MNHTHLTDDQLRDTIAGLLPDLTDELIRLTAIPSVGADGFPTEPLEAAYAAVAGLVAEAAPNAVIERLDLPEALAPVLLATVPGPEGAPTVLVYTHYDVVPEGEPTEWHTPAFEPALIDGAVHGRGAADSKANIIAVIGALRALGGQPPVTLKIVIEGQEEFGGPFDHYPPHNPELFAADAMVIADVGSVRPGTPTLSVALRGSASVRVEAHTLGSDKHSGLYGGAAPDARIALLHALASLHDANGDVAVPGLRRDPWTGVNYTEEEFRSLAEILPDVPLQGTGTLGERIWSGPAISVIAFDAPSTHGPQNAVAGHAAAVLNLRVHPEQDAAEAQAALISHLEAQRPFGISLKVVAEETGNGFAAATSGVAFEAAKDALSRAWGAPTELMAGGGSIPIVMSLDEAVPAAEKVMFGATDGFANIHGPNERVLVDELAKATAAMTLFLTEYAARKAR